MAKRKKRPPKSKSSTHMISRHANVPRFLVMLAIGLIVLVLTIYAAATNSPVVDTPVDDAPTQSQPPSDS